MPRSETILSVFVASPNDVSEERDTVDQIVNEINSAHARRTGVRFEVLRWERDVSPAAGKDPQAIVNDQIPRDYDVFLGILWNRLGSPTNRADSGTVEEYELAKERFDRDPNSIHLMLYCKDAPPATMDGFDPDQYKKVVEFRKRIEKEVFYRKFVGGDDFANSIRIDLTKLIYEAASVHGGAAVDAAATEQTGRASIDDGACLLEGDEEEGYFELTEAFEEEMEFLGATLTRMSESIADMGTSMNGRTEEITALNPSVDGKNLSRNERQKFRAEASGIIKQSAKDMDIFVRRMKQDIPLFRRHLDKSISAFTKAVPIYLELNDGEDKEGLKDTIGSSLNAMTEMLKAMEKFRDTVDALPRIATSLNRSRRETKGVLQEVVEIARGGMASQKVVLSMLP